METRSSPPLEVLHRLAQYVSLEGYNDMPKAELFQSLKTKYPRLLRLEHRRSQSSSSSASSPLFKKRKLEERDSSNMYSAKKKRQSNQGKGGLNTIDPIMLCPIGKKKTFIFTRPNGTMVQFNVDTLIDYLLSTGDFTDPETRISFSDEDMARLDQVAKEIGLEKPSALSAKNDANRYSDVKFRRDALLGLERCAGEVVTEMLDIVENYDPDDAQMQLVMNEFPTFLDYFRQLREAEPAYAAKCMAHWRLFMEGPPNRPNRDEFGLLRVVIHFLKSCSEGRL